MDYDKLIEQLNAWNEQHLSVVCGGKHFACDYLCENEDCIVVRAATALSTLKDENKSLRVLVELGNTRAKDYRVMRDRAVKAEAENEKLRAELEQVKTERDAAVKDLNGFLSLDELCPIQCKWCKWEGIYCDGKTPEWRGPQKED